jgi:alkylresorcinol/alkylpyrone synthase
MSHLIGLGLAVPPYAISQSTAKTLAVEHFRGALTHLDRLAVVFDHARIDMRYSAAPLDWWLSGAHSFKERNDLYLNAAIELSTQAALKALAEAGIAPEAVDNLIVVSSSGIATPSLDARLMNCLPLRRDVRRTPIWGLGCAGGVAGLARAAEMGLAYPESITLLIAVETCSLTFQFEDRSKKNFVAASLFGDGAAALVIVGSARPERGIEIIDAQSTLWPDSINVMGWDVVDTGLDVVFGAQIPRYVVDLFRPEVDRFLIQHDLTVAQIDQLVLHPGGTRVVEAYEKALGVPTDKLDGSWAALRNYGNMSSPTVFFVLDWIKRQANPQSGQYGLLGALGPGFSAEQVLIRF